MRSSWHKYNGKTTDLIWNQEMFLFDVGGRTQGFMHAIEALYNY
jgi:hypothetical protein